MKVTFPVPVIFLHVPTPIPGSLPCNEAESPHAESAGPALAAGTGTPKSRVSVSEVRQLAFTMVQASRYIPSFPGNMATVALGELYEDFRLEKIIKNTRNLSPKEIAYKILDDVINFSKDGKYSDDKTLVVIKRTT